MVLSLFKKSEDTKGVMRSRQSKKGSQYNSLKKKDKSLKGQTMIYKLQHIKTKD
jgi:hypothetical protein